jgi:hypothetical protein
MNRTTWLIVAALASMTFVQPNNANAFNNGSLDGTYRGRGAGSFYSIATTTPPVPSYKFDFVSTELFTFDGNGATTEILTYTYEGASALLKQGGPCTDIATGSYHVNQDGTGTSTYNVTSSTCADLGGTYTFDFTTDGEYVYRILTSDTSFAAFSIAGTSRKDGPEFDRF